MRARFSVRPGKFLFPLISVLTIFLLSGCRRNIDELSVTPPATYPLTGDYIGFGVVNVSFVHLLSEPGPAGISRAYLRRGTITRVTERRPVLDGGVLESWVMAEGNYDNADSAVSGWLEEAMLDVFDSESRANTASRAMSR